jgi:hypothetical protein
MCPVNQGLCPARGDRVIQIPAEWPARYGTLLEVDSTVVPSAVLIVWDDGRQDWIEDEDIRPLRIWFISDDEPKREQEPGPLERQLARFMEAEPALLRRSRFPKGRS